MTHKNSVPKPTQQQFHQAISYGADAWYGACLRITRDEALAQDAVQEALLNGWAKRHQFRGSSKLETWIHRIAVNCALAMIRKRHRHDWMQLDENISDDAATLFERYATDELGQDLHSALQSLSELERVCFVLKHLEQWRLREIAEQLAIGIGPVKQALFRAVKKLRSQMTNLTGET